MILGCLGKGGSGKSSVSTQIALHCNAQAKVVLAVDADHNMDLSYNLSGGKTETLPHFSGSLQELLKSVSADDQVSYADIFVKGQEACFYLNPLSSEIDKYSELLPNGIRLMTAGPQTDTVLYGKACSHVLTTPLKVLLPLLKVKSEEIVVVDEKAGADGVSTGIVTGIDVGVIVCEPALHSVKTAQQIAELMDFYNTPYIFVGNKITSQEDRDFISSKLSSEPVVFLSDNSDMKRDPTLLVNDWTKQLERVVETARSMNSNDRLERTIAKFERNRDFAEK